MDAACCSYLRSVVVLCLADSGHTHRNFYLYRMVPRGNPVSPLLTNMPLHVAGAKRIGPAAKLEAEFAGRLAKLGPCDAAEARRLMSQLQECLTPALSSALADQAPRPAADAEAIAALCVRLALGYFGSCQCHACSATPHQMPCFFPNDDARVPSSTVL